MSDHPLKRLIQKLTGQDGEAAAMRESLEEVIVESERESPALSAQERVMLGNLLKFGELKVRDVMVPRAEIIAVDESINLADLLMLFGEAQHSRLPMFRETLDDPTGLIHVKDVLGLLQPYPAEHMESYPVQETLDLRDLEDDPHLARRALRLDPDQDIDPDVPAS